MREHHEDHARFHEMILGRDPHSVQKTLVQVWLRMNQPIATAQGMKQNIKTFKVENHLSTNI